MEHFDDGIFPLLRNLCPLPNADDDVKQSVSQGGTTVEGSLEKPDENAIRSKEQMASVNSCVAG